jgi:hypothetical protein
MVENVTSAKGVLIDSIGKHRGLGQFDQPTWKSTMRVDWSKVVDPALGVEGIAKLYLKNEKSHSIHFPSIPYTLETAYLYHNQGASSAKRFLQSGDLVYPKQSHEAVDTMRLARKQHVHNSKNRRYVA